MKMTLLLLLALLVTVAARAETLFDLDFSTQPAGEILVGQSISNNDGVAHFWQGPQAGEHGHFAITEGPENAGKSVLAIYDSNSENNKAPVFSIDLAKIPEAKVLVVEAKFLIPVSGSYRGLIGLGKGSWTSAAAIFTLTDGKIATWQPGDVYTNVGSYSPNTWMTLRVAFDLAKKTYDVQVNDQKTGSNLPWAHTKNTSLTYFEFAADLQPRDRGGDPVLYFDSVKITTE